MSLKYSRPECRCCTDAQEDRAEQPGHRILSGTKQKDATNGEKNPTYNFQSLNETEGLLEHF